MYDNEGLILVPPPYNDHYIRVYANRGAFCLQQLGITGTGNNINVWAGMVRSVAAGYYVYNDLVPNNVANESTNVLDDDHCRELVEDGGPDVQERHFERFDYGGDEFENNLWDLAYRITEGVIERRRQETDPDT